MRLVMNVDASLLVIEAHGVDGTYELEETGIVPRPLTAGLVEFYDKERISKIASYGAATLEDFNALCASRAKSVCTYNTAFRLMKEIGTGSSENDDVAASAVSMMGYRAP